MLSMAMAIGMSAQQPTQPPTGQPAPPSGQTSAPRPSGQSDQAMTTFTGCVQAGGGAAGAAGAAGSAASGATGGYILTSVSPSGSAAGGSTAAAGTAGTTGTTARGSSYRLTGGEDLQKYVGQRVEITGNVSGRADSSTGSSAGAPGAGAGAAGAGAAGAGGSASASGASMQTLRVTSVKPASGSCQQ